jgi:hypothetical protein
MLCAAKPLWAVKLRNRTPELTSTTRLWVVARNMEHKRIHLGGAWIVGNEGWEREMRIRINLVLCLSNGIWK